MCAYAGMRRLYHSGHLLPKQHQQYLEEDVMQLKAGVLTQRLHKKVFMKQASSPCSWDDRAVKLCIYPREETACQHEFKTNSN